MHIVVNWKYVGDPELLGREALLHVAGRQPRRAGAFSYLLSPPRRQRSDPPAGECLIFQLADSYQGRRFYASKERVAKFEGAKNSDVSIPQSPPLPLFPTGRCGTRETDRSQGNYTVSLIEGDGIGPEISGAVKNIFAAAKVRLDPPFPLLRLLPSSTSRHRRENEGSR